MKFSTAFLLFDDRLAARDVPPLSPWWRGELTRFLDAFEAGEAAELWAAVGRGGSKSTALYKLALFFALHGEFTIPPAERHWAIVISRQRGEAEKGIILISRWLHALKIEHRAVGSEIELAARNRGIRVVGASVGAASGWRSFFVGCDEFSKWSHEGAAIMLDADEILTSARAMTATHPHTPVVVFSSPWIDAGSFFDTIRAGDVPGRIVSGPAASWIANPEAATEDSLRRKERNPTKFRREYGCEFSSSFEGGFFDPASIDACTDLGRSPLPPAPTPGVSQHFMAIDPAFIADLFAIVVGHVEPGRVVIDHVEALTPPKGAPLSADRAVTHCVRLRQRYPGPRQVWTDQASATALRDMFARSGVVLSAEPWTMETKVTRYTLARNLMVDRRVRLPDDPALNRELGNIGVKLTASGNETIGTRAGHDDRASALVHCLHVCQRFGGFGVAYDDSHAKGGDYRAHCETYGELPGEPGAPARAPRQRGDRWYLPDRAEPCGRLYFEQTATGVVRLTQSEWRWRETKDYHGTLEAERYPGESVNDYRRRLTADAQRAWQRTAQQVFRRPLADDPSVPQFTRYQPRDRRGDTM